MGKLKKKDDLARVIKKFGGVRNETKTHHKPGYHKPVKNPTTNAAPDTHKEFCKRCFSRNGYKYCPNHRRKECSL